MTVYKAKGLEWRCVVAMGLDETSLHRWQDPSQESDGRDKMEPNRVAYVGAPLQLAAFAASYSSDPNPSPLPLQR